MCLLTGQWQTAIDGITDHPGTTDHPWRHAALPARVEYNEFPENSGWSCQAVLFSHARHRWRRGNSRTAEQRRYRHVNSQKIDRRLTSNVIRKSINSANYRLIESRFTSLIVLYSHHSAQQLETEKIMQHYGLIWLITETHQCEDMTYMSWHSLVSSQCLCFVIAVISRLLSKQTTMNCDLDLGES